MLPWIFASSIWLCAASSPTWREVLLQQARLRIGKWYRDPNLVETPEVRSGISLTMLKHDQVCANDIVPVTFAEFDIQGARPVDVFNAMLDTPAQRDWNPQCAAVKALGDWHDEGARAWAVNFHILFLNVEIFQWQVADANFASEEFWLVFSTQNNSELLIKSPLVSGATESSNCLGSYHITKGMNGSHVVITQHVNAHPIFPFPLHDILKLFPLAWKGTIDFVGELRARAKYQASLGWSASRTVAPAFMLSREQKESDESPLHNASAAEDGFFIQTPKDGPNGTSFFAWPAGLVLLVLCCLCTCCMVGVCIKSCFARRSPGEPAETGGARSHSWPKEVLNAVSTRTFSGMSDGSGSQRSYAGSSDGADSESDTTGCLNKKFVF